ncbi:MAG: CcmD family protein [Bacteroidetes bacterium]|nr:CcmD family protein [Bacteroidota bacterium]
MDNMPYLFAAFAIIWALLFYYIYRMTKRQKEMMEDIQRLRTLLAEKQKGN